MTSGVTPTVLVGAVAGAFGVRGEVKVKSFTDQPEDVFDYAPFCDEAGRVILTVQSWRHIKDGFAAYVVEVTNRDEAQALKSTKLYARREVLPDLEPDEYYQADLVGLAVEDLEGSPLGQVKAVVNYGAGDLLEISGTPGAKGVWLLPFTLEAAPHVDMIKRRITADPPAGLIRWSDGREEGEASDAPEERSSGADQNGGQAGS